MTVTHSPSGHAFEPSVMPAPTGGSRCSLCDYGRELHVIPRSRRLVVVDERFGDVFGTFGSIRQAEAWAREQYGTDRGWHVQPIRKVDL